MANLLQLTQRLHRELGYAGTGPTTIAGATVDHRRLFDAVSDAWTRLQTRDVDWRFMRKQLAAGVLALNTTTYAPATAFSLSDFGRWRAPYSSDGGDLEYTPRCFLSTDTTHLWPLEWLPFEAFSMTYLDGSHAAGKPTYWSIGNGNEMLIGPKPESANYRLKADYRRAVQILSEDAHTPTDLPVEHHNILVWRALLDIGAFDAAQEAIARAQRNFAEMEGDLLQGHARGLQFGDALA